MIAVACTTPAAALADAAEALAGARFRLHGRDPATGLDCLGVLAGALAAIGLPAPIPQGYRLRSLMPENFAAIAQACGFVPAAGPLRSGDVLVVRPSACQLHFVIAGNGGRFVHAHAGLGKVVAAPGPLSWPVASHWRLAATD